MTTPKKSQLPDLSFLKDTDAINQLVSGSGSAQRQLQDLNAAEKWFAGAANTLRERTTLAQRYTEALQELPIAVEAVRKVEEKLKVAKREGKEDEVGNQVGEKGKKKNVEQDSSGSAAAAAPDDDGDGEQAVTRSLLAERAQAVQAAKAWIAELRVLRVKWTAGMVTRGDRRWLEGA